MLPEARTTHPAPGRPWDGSTGNTEPPPLKEKKKIKTGKKYQRERNENIPNLEQRLLAEQSAAGNREGKKKKKDEV